MRPETSFKQSNRLEKHLWTAEFLLKNILRSTKILVKFFKIDDRSDRNGKLKDVAGKMG